jgi:hypothetical protein
MEEKLRRKVEMLWGVRGRPETARKKAITKKLRTKCSHYVTNGLLRVLPLVLSDGIKLTLQ